jgi:trk system potassium uptake protein TrkH
MAFFLIYVLVFSSGVITMALLGMDFETSVGATIASLGNIGPGIGHVGPVDNYAQISPIGKWVLSFLMLLGRLELFTVLIIFSPSFWRS